MTLGRKPEAIDCLESYMERDEKVTDRYPVGTMGTFNRETDIAWDSQDNMYISDGYGNSHIVKIAKDGTWVKAVATHGNGSDQFATPHSIAVDKQAALVYVAAERRSTTSKRLLRKLLRRSSASKNFVSVSVTGKTAHFQAIDINGKPLDEFEWKNPSGDCPC